MVYDVWCIHVWYIVISHTMKDMLVATKKCNRCYLRNKSQIWHDQRENALKLRFLEMSKIQNTKFKIQNSNKKIKDMTTKKQMPYNQGFSRWARQLQEGAQIRNLFLHRFNAISVDCMERLEFSVPHICEKTFRGLCYENTRLWKTGIDALYTYNIHTCIDCIRFFFLFFSSSDFMCSCNKIHCLKKKNQRQYQRLDVFLLPRTKYRYRYRYNYKYKYKCKYRSKYRYSYKYRYRFRYRYKWLFYV